VLTRWQGGLTSVVVTLVTIGLVILDLSDGAFRSWWLGHALTTDTVSGLLVLLLTVLVVDQVVRRRQLRDRSRAIAAQSAIMVNQATRSVRAVSAALTGSGDRSDAADEVRTYMIMLLVGAPVLIDARISRTFLEEAQHLGAEMARALTTTARTPGSPPASVPRLDDAVARLRAASAPLLALLEPEEQAAASQTESR
jgi:hypothetical protein